MQSSLQPCHSLVSQLVPSPPSLLSLPGSLVVQFLPLFLEAHPFLGVLGGLQGPCLLVCLEVPLENSNSIS
jgi:hypothetical protein